MTLMALVSASAAAATTSTAFARDYNCAKVIVQQSSDITLKPSRLFRCPRSIGTTPTRLRLRLRLQRQLFLCFFGAPIYWGPACHAPRAALWLWGEAIESPGQPPST